MIEYKVRPVVRYIVTRYESEEQGTGSSVTLGEYPNEEIAEKVCSVLESAECPEPPASYVVVGKHFFTPDNIALFAYSQEEAVMRKAEAEARYGKEFQVFRSN